jgi:formylglycine-generating enzyme required for sulfatase activity
MKKVLTFLSLAVGLFLLTSAVNETYKKGFIKIPEGFVFVPSGNVKVDTATLSVQSFFIAKQEVTNLQYRTFLYALKAKGDTASYRLAMVDSTKWRNRNAYNEPYVDYYFSHPAYASYPVVNVPYAGAVLYCKWLTEKYLATGGTIKNEFRLPFRAEWIMAARGGSALAEYSWGGPYLRGEKGKYLCNFKNLGAESIHYNAEKGTYEVIPTSGGVGSISDGADVTAPVSSYTANAFGLFNMCGNAAELVQEKGIAVGGSWNSPGYDVRVESVMNVDGPSPSVGFRPVVTFYDPSVNR